MVVWTKQETDELRNWRSTFGQSVPQKLNRPKHKRQAGYVTHEPFVCVCVEVLRPSQPNGVMPSEISLPKHTFKRLTSIVHILSPETDNCPSWISGRERMTVENISWSISTNKCCRPRRGSKTRPPGLQSDVHPTESPRPVGPAMNRYEAEPHVLNTINLSVPLAVINQGPVVQN